MPQYSRDVVLSACTRIRVQIFSTRTRLLVLVLVLVGNELVVKCMLGNPLQISDVRAGYEITRFHSRAPHILGKN